MIKKYLFNLLSLIVFLLGLFLLVNSNINLTGAMIGLPVNSNAGMFSGVLSITLSCILYVLGGLETKTNEIKISYDKHALDRMEERKIFPMLVGLVIEEGEHYKLKKAKNFGEAKGATDVYVLKESADVLPGGKIGERIITIDPSRKKEYQSIMILTKESASGGNKKIVKTVFVNNSQKLDWFLNQYVY